jgi:prokaryotic ubiquitin-like protein Pup
MSESRFERGHRAEEETLEEESAKAAEANDDDFDSLLDEIDGVLESNAAEFVRSFVQKGGQ